VRLNVFAGLGVNTPKTNRIIGIEQVVGGWMVALWWYYEIIILLLVALLISIIINLLLLFSLFFYVTRGAWVAVKASEAWPFRLSTFVIYTH
jgi:hypothetical protein